MRVVNAFVMVAALSGTTLVTTDARSQSAVTTAPTTAPAPRLSTTTPVSRLNVGSVVTGDIQSATIIDKSDNGFAFRINPTDDRGPIIVVINGLPPAQEFSIADGWKAINDALDAIGFKGDDVGPSKKCTQTNITIIQQTGSGAPSATVNCTIQ